ncbi:hypothetical protein QBC44DRAFT_392685 [Cladorrhinum sp. PSN332]|nr:hypothetical protein QBC44DRAFT_392685 [Cladorrhinum sp. PSN332]
MTGEDFSSQLRPGDLEQWRLLLSICPIFGHPHPWTAKTPNPNETSVVQTQAQLLQLHILEIPLHIPTDSFIPPNYLDDFQTDIDDMLLHLAHLVNDADLTNKPPKLQGIEKLWALNELMESDASEPPKSLAHFGRYLYLAQDQADFKRRRRGVERFIECTKTRFAKGSSTQDFPYAQARTSNPWSLKSSFQRPFFSSSNHLFERLVAHLEPCSSRQTFYNDTSDLHHRAMLQFNYSQFLVHDEFLPDMALMLGCCIDQNAWHRMQCTISSSGLTSNTGAARPSPLDTASIQALCQEAKDAYEADRFYVVELRGDAFHDISDNWYDQRPQHDAKPTKSMRDLLRCQILKPSNYEGFRPSDKKMLAFTVAHALLHLHPGPWIQGPLGLDNIFFLYDETTKTVYNIHHPHMTCLLAHGHPEPGVLDSDPENKYPILLSFAKFLVELETGEEVVPKARHETGRPNLRTPLLDFYEKKCRQLLDSHFADALWNSLTFQKRVLEERDMDPHITVEDIILKRIVHPLEKRLDIKLKMEWGNRDMPLREPDSTPNPHKSRPTSVLNQARVATTQVSRPLLERRSGASSAQSSMRARWDKGKNILPAVSVAKKSCTPTKEGSVVPSRGLKPKQQNINPPRAASMRTSPNPGTSKPTNGPARRNAATLRRHETPTNRVVNSANLTNSQPAAAISDPEVTESRKSVIAGGRSDLLQTLQHFAEFSAMSCRFLNQAIDNRLQYCRTDRTVKIAVLDTGLDLRHPDFEHARAKSFRRNAEGEFDITRSREKPQKERIKEWRNFCTDEKDGNDHVEDIDGHGTALAGILLRLAPHTDLYVARVSLTKSSQVGIPQDQEMYRKPDPDVVAKAIRWAISKEVDIINLSLGFRGCSWDELSEMRSALEEAKQNNIVVFAATSNEGSHESIAWPASDAQYAIGIHSCTDSGTTKSTFTAPASDHGFNFMVVGERILSQRIRARGAGFETWTGSSFATPVATAIGAFVLRYVWQTVAGNERLEAEARLGGVDGLEKIQSNNGMAKVLKAIGRPVEGQYFSIPPTIFWGSTLYERNKDPDRDAQEAKAHAWRMITKALGPSG